ncbi:MAG: hypothetical protein KatS3mg009_1039 [Acidimicrobiia bacterium]|nr:MAG: hypothetical protein KatS3mg009_1039 [Acidimicrobiia bacterium]
MTTAAARYVGARVPRVEDTRLLTGRGTYVDDVTLPGMLHARFVRSPYARAAIRGIDASEALAVPGVRHVFTAADLNPGVREQWHTSVGPQGPETPRPPLAEGEVRFVGDPVALVVAETLAIAHDAAELVVVDYEPLPPVVDYTTAEHADALVHESHGSNVIGELSGRPLAALQEQLDAAALVVRREDRAARVRARADGGTRHGRRLLAGDGRADDPRRHPVTPRVAHVLRTPARDPRAPRPGDHA